MHIKLGVKDIAQMVLLELLHKPPSPEAPNLDNLIVTDEAPRCGIEYKCTHECAVPNECTVRIHSPVVAFHTLI